MLTKSRLKQLTSLHTKKYRQQENLILVEGKRLLDQIHKNGIRIQELFCLEEEGQSFSYLQSDIVTYCQVWQLNKLAQTQNPQPVIGLVSAIRQPVTNSDFLLYLDGITNPGNLGTIFRTALGLGIDGIVTSPDCCDLFNPKVVRASLGAVLTCPSNEKDINWLLNQKAYILTASLQNSTDINELKKIVPPLILVIGSEAYGVDRRIEQAANQRIRIPMTGKMESLNAAVASAITIYHLITHGLIKR